jgi:thiamine biosynthesis lipoprotein
MIATELSPTMRRHCFKAMGSPCEVQVESGAADLIEDVGALAEAEALRIERKYSRYRADSVLSAINASNGAPVRVDDETAALLDYADHCFSLSDGRFDVTSGVLRRAWTFDGSDRVPTRRQVDALRSLIGWRRVQWRRPYVTLAEGMQIDLGGLGKEYAVDTALLKITRRTTAPVLVNFGGDLRVSGLRSEGRRWRVAIEGVDGSAPDAWLEIAGGAITTSGDARRFLLKDGVRYSHILDPRTGWPVRDAPRSVTVAAGTCMAAGAISTLAMLHGRGAEAFLRREGVKAWITR